MPTSAYGKIMNRLQPRPINDEASTMTRRFTSVLHLTAVFVLASLAADRGDAEVVDLTFYRREQFANGQSFGDVGPYEKLVGVARFAVDPKHPRNKDIVDLDKAPRNADGKVEFESDVFILAPKDRGKGNGAILYDVNNRGNKLALGMFNSGGGGNDPNEPGNGFLFRRGYTVVWCGWIGEVLPGNNRMLLKPPIATENGKPIKGVVRFEMVSDKAAETLPLSRREGHGSYSPTMGGEEKGTLTWRMRETDERVPIPREQWKLERIPLTKVEHGVQGALQQIRCRLSGRFRPGYIYELICECENPIVQGLGFAAVRDLISFLRYEKNKQNPLLKESGDPAISRTHGFGVSQSGRFLRHLLYQGFNTDEKDRKVFDGLMPHVAGGGLGFFNHRFAQPTRHNGQHEEHLYPGDMYPFTYGDSPLGYIHATDNKPVEYFPARGILSRIREESPGTLPKVMHTQSAAEYWHRSGSLVHTNSLGTKDAAEPAEVRIYAFGGTQHGPAGDPPNRGMAENLANPGDYRPLLRGLLDALDAWVKEGTEPPPSVHPRIEKGTLTDWRQKSTGFPGIPGVRYPEVIQRPHTLNFGPNFLRSSQIDHEPPEILGHYVVLVPKSDADGNDLGCLLPPEVAVPLATYTGWNLRSREVGAGGMLASLMGSYIPFPRTDAERRPTGDPRRSIEERYASFDEYKKRCEAACAELVKQRYMPQEDADRFLSSRDKVRGLFTK
jgi:hypothetical protein